MPAMTCILTIAFIIYLMAAFLVGLLIGSVTMFIAENRLHRKELARLYVLAAKGPENKKGKCGGCV